MPQTFSRQRGVQVKKETDYNLIVILGPTASGKTSLAAQLAAEIGSEIISADSRQVYRGMDIGTGKDLADYVVNGTAVPCHLVDIADPSGEFSVYDFQRKFDEVFDNISSRGIIPVLVGGTGLYLEAVIKGYHFITVPENGDLRKKLRNLKMEELVDRLKGLRPKLHNTTDIKHRERLIRAIEIAQYIPEHGTETGNRARITPLVAGIRWPRKELRDRIAKRLNARFDGGMIEEVERLHAIGVSWERLDYFGLEYRYIGQYLQGRMNRNEMHQKLFSAICKFAKRQETWFRRMEKNGVTIRWIDNADYAGLKETVFSALAA